MATLTISTPTIQQGGSLVFSLAGFNANELVYFEFQNSSGVVLGSASNYVNASGAGTFSYTLGDAPGSYILHVRNSNYVTPHYDLTKPYTISGSTVTPTLTISPVSAAPNTARTVVFTGFQPNASVTLTRVGGGYWALTANSSGGGTYSITPGESAGSYTLQATDSYGHSATASFTVTGTTSNPTLSISPSSIVQGNTINVIYAGFPGNTLVTLTNVQTGGYWTLSTIASGSGTWSGLGPINDAPGTYTLRAVDSAGHTATATLTVTAAPSMWTLLATINLTVPKRTAQVGWALLTTVNLTVKQRAAVQNWIQLVMINLQVPQRATIQNWVQLVMINMTVSQRTSVASWTQLASMNLVVPVPSGGDGGDGDGGLSTGAAVAIGLGVVTVAAAVAMSQPKVREKVTSTAKKAATKAKAMLKG